jgi:hypothetical protein
MLSSPMNPVKDVITLSFYLKTAVVGGNDSKRIPEDLGTTVKPEPKAQTRRPTKQARRQTRTVQKGKDTATPTTKYDHVKWLSISADHR